MQPREVQAQDDTGEFGVINHSPAVNEQGSDTAPGWPGWAVGTRTGQEIGPCVGLAPGTYSWAGQGCGVTETSPAEAPLGQALMAPGG